MTALELEEELVLDIVQDNSFEDKVRPYLNRGLMWIAARFDLASLDTEDTVSCVVEEDHIALPENYNHGVYWVGRDNVLVGTPAYYNEFPRFQRYHPDLTQVSQINDVAVKGTNLYYSGRETVDLKIRFFESPLPLSKPTSVPVCLPDHLHEALLGNYAAWKIFEIIEDGIEDKKTNTSYYRGLFMNYLADLEMYTIKTAGPVYVQDEADRIV